MLTRYARPEMTALWTAEHRLGIMLEIELLACEAMELRGEVPKGTTAACRANAANGARRRSSGSACCCWPACSSPRLR